MEADICKRFGQNVRRIRRAQEMSQEDLAHRADLHRTYLSSIERAGGRNPSLRAIDQIAKALGVTPGSLLDEEVNTQRK